MAHIVDISELLLVLGLSDTVTDTERAIANFSLTQAEGAVKSFLKYDPTQARRTEWYPSMDFDHQASDAVWEVDDNTAYLRRLAEASTDELQVKHIPIRSVPALDLRIDLDGRSGTRDSSFGTETRKTEGTDYWCDYDGVDDSGNKVSRDGIIRSIGRWPTTAQSVQVTYTAGYTSDELTGKSGLVDATPIWASVLDEAARRARGLFQKAKSSTAGWLAGPLKSEKLGDYSYTAGFSDKQLGALYGETMDLTMQSREALNSFVNMGHILAS